MSEDLPTEPTVDDVAIGAQVTVCNLVVTSLANNYVGVTHPSISQNPIRVPIGDIVSIDRPPPLCRSLYLVPGSRTALRRCERHDGHDDLWHIASEGTERRWTDHQEYGKLAEDEEVTRWG